MTVQHTAARTAKKYNMDSQYTFSDYNTLQNIRRYNAIFSYNCSSNNMLCEYGITLYAIMDTAKILTVIMHILLQHTATYCILPRILTTDLHKEFCVERE